MAIQSGPAFIEQMRWRYAVKKFDPSKKISPETWAALEECLVLTPSSYGLQPWKFFVVQNLALRKELRTHSWNQSQVEDCSHYVVFAAKKTMEEADIERYIDRIVQVRKVPKESLEGFKKGMSGDVVTGPRSESAKEWASRQAYIALGNFMTAAAVLGVDACPMEGLNPEKYDQALGLNEGPYGVVMACAAGYRHADDRFAQMPKVRFPTAEVIEYR